MDIVERLPVEDPSKKLTEVNANLSLNPKEVINEEEDEKLDTTVEGQGDENGELDGDGDESSIVDNENEEEEEDGAPEAKVAKLSEETDEQSNQSVGAVENKPRKGKAMHQCPECEKRFVKKGFLTKHLKSHRQPRPFVCDHEDCEKAFVNTKSLEKHVKSVHQGEEFMLHMCPFCHKGFITRAEMDNHAETHLADFKMYACRYCGKTFTKKFAMKIAVQASQDSTCDQCPYCNKIVNPKAYKDN